MSTIYKEESHFKVDMRKSKKDTWKAQLKAVDGKHYTIPPRGFGGFGSKEAAYCYALWCIDKYKDAAIWCSSEEYINHLNQ